MSASPVDALAGTAGGVHLDAGQYTAVWRVLGLGEKRLILDTPDHGATYAERDALDARALSRLADVGFADASGAIAPALADACDVVRAPAVEADVRILTGAPPRGILACSRGGLGVVADLDGTGGLRLDPTHPEDLPAALLARVPDEPALPGVGMTVPADALLGPDIDLTERERRLRRAGVPKPVLDRLTAMWAQPPRRVLQFGVAHRDADGVRHRGPTVITVVDTVTGRVTVRRGRGGETVVLTPTDRARLRVEVAALLTAARDRATASATVDPHTVR